MIRKFLLCSPVCTILLLLGVLLFSPVVGRAFWETEYTPPFLFHYQSVDKTVVQALSAQTDKIYNSVTDDLGYVTEQKILVYLCPTPECFAQQQPSSVKLPEWAVGVAYPGLNRIVMRSALTASEQGVIRPVEILKHEFAHIALEQALHEHGGAPRWLSEGFSMYEASQWTLHGQRIIEEITLRDAFLPLNLLTTAFPADEENASIAYAQCLSLVTFMFRAYGKYDFQEFIIHLREGMDTDTALLHATGRNLKSLEQEWQASLRGRPFWFTALMNRGIFWFGLSMIFLITYLVKRLRMRQIQQRWEVEDRTNNLGNEGEEIDTNMADFDRE